MLLFIEVNGQNLKSLMSVRLFIFIRPGSRPVFFDSAGSLFFFGRQSCFSDGVSRDAVITVLVETLSQLPAFSLLSCFGTNKEWITNCLKALYLQHVPIVSR